MDVRRRNKIRLWWIGAVWFVLIESICGSTAGAVEGLKLELLSTTWAGHTHYTIRFKVTNVGNDVKRDLNLFVTGQDTSNWGSLPYVGKGVWEKDLPSGTVQATVSGPIAAPPGESTEYPYEQIGTLFPGNSSFVEVSVDYKGTAKSAWPGAVAISWQIEEGKTKISSKNRPPIAYKQKVTTTKDTPVEIILQATDPDGDGLFFNWSSPDHGTIPGMGTVTPTHSFCRVVYTPDPGYVGEDGFTFGVYDGKAWSEPATVSITVQGPQPVTGLSDDFEDGNYTSNPTWVISNPGYTWAAVQPDPVRSGNLALAIHGTDQAHGALDAPVDVPYRGFDVSMEYLATTASAAHPFLAVTNGPVSMIVYYWSESARLSLEEYVDGTEYWHHGAAGSLSANTWYRIHMWHDRSSNLVRAEIRSLGDNALIGEQSFAPVTDLLTQPPITKVRIAAEETAPQYIDNVTLTPPLPGI